MAVLMLLLNGCRAGDEIVGPGPGALLRDERLLMGTRFQIQAVTGDEEAGVAAMEAAFAEVARIEALLSEWRESSELSAVNRAAGRQPVTVGPDLYAVVERSLGISKLSGGAFDVTFAGCGGLWSFREPRIPSAGELAACLPRVDFRAVVLDPEPSSIFLSRADMRIGLSGIGKGYGVDRAAAVLEARGIHDYIVDGGGDIRLKGRKRDRPWSSGIAHPRRRGELYATLHPTAGAIVTSGDYERYFEREGVRYHHILDPTTGRPARRSVAVTVIASSAMDADALATGLFVMGPEEGLALVESLPGVEALVFGPELAVHLSSGFPEITVLPP
ncbi:MAG: FAD:protein FMN transferase [bacterium]|nr:FAD:protein FMN transferase [bacterium]